MHVKKCEEIYAINTTATIYKISQILHKNPSQSLVYVAEDTSGMEICSKSIRFLNPNVGVLNIPHSDMGTKNNIFPDLLPAARKLESLYQLTANPEKQFFICTTLCATLQYTTPTKIIKEKSLRFITNNEYAHAQIAEQLTEMGYLQTKMSCNAGEFTARGSIIDIVTIDSSYRLDFFGDTLEQIRIFDPVTQKSFTTISRAHIAPFREVISEQATIDCLSNYIANNSEYKNIMEDIANKRHYSRAERLIKIAYPEASSILSLLPENCTVITSEHLPEKVSEFHESLNHKTYQHQILSTQQWQQQFTNKPKIKITPTAVNQEEKTTQEILPPIQSILKSINLTPVKMLQLLKSQQSTTSAQRSVEEIALSSLLSKKHIVICMQSDGALKSATQLLKDKIQFSIAHTLNDLNAQNKTTVPNIWLMQLPIPQGLIIDSTAFIAEKELFGQAMGRTIKKVDQSAFEKANKLQTGDIIAHKTYGIGKFIGIETVTVSSTLSKDCIAVEYANKDKLFVPVENMNLITKYGPESSQIDLSRLGSKTWQTKHARIKTNIYAIADQLLKTAAHRELTEAESLAINREQYDHFCNQFEHIETEDQLKAFRAIEQDLCSGKPMDRLICGDTGFGKTEVAIRASFAVATANPKKQVLLLVPTVMLCQQHYNTFSERFKGTDIIIRQLSSATTSSYNKITKQMIENGRLDILIGTHGAINRKFQNLGLLIIDEEHHFGVKQKESLKQTNPSLHILYLSATPIPRTLQMALTNTADLSILNSPPFDREPVNTNIIKYDLKSLKEIVTEEKQRNGSTYLVCPRISDIEAIKSDVIEAIPGISIKILHGEVPKAESEQIVEDFYNQKIDLLIATTIVESGINVPHANTIIIYNSHMFGLSQLYQLRGRVGRSSTQGYAYFCIPQHKKNDEKVMQRLNIINSLDKLGVGLIVASHDMDMRGFGNMAGSQQSGQIKEIGLEMYQQMLQDAIIELQAESSVKADAKIIRDSPININTDINARIPEEYVDDSQIRLGLYQQLASCKNKESIDYFLEEINDRFGKAPDITIHLIEIAKLKILCMKAGIGSLTIKSNSSTIQYNHISSSPEVIIEYITKNPKKAKIINQSTIALTLQHKHEPIARIQEVGQFIELIMNR